MASPLPLSVLRVAKLSRKEAERRRRYVSSSRTDEFGLRTVIARVEGLGPMSVTGLQALLARTALVVKPVVATPG